MNKNNPNKLYVDEHIVRIIAAQVIVLTAITLLTLEKLPVFLLAADFAIRAFTTLPTLLAAVARTLADLYKIKPKPVFAPPKKFAAALGFLLSLVLLILLYLHLTIAVYVTGSILIFCALLESVFKICLGCYVYNLIIVPISAKIKKT